MTIASYSTKPCFPVVLKLELLLNPSDPEFKKDQSYHCSYVLPGFVPAILLAVKGISYQRSCSNETACR
jgi:hypothetical protein